MVDVPVRKILVILRAAKVQVLVRQRVRVRSQGLLQIALQWRANVSMSGIYLMMPVSMI